MSSKDNIKTAILVLSNYQMERYKRFFCLSENAHSSAQWKFIQINVQRKEYSKSGDIALVVLEGAVIGVCACALVRKSGDFDDLVELCNWAPFRIKLDADTIKKELPSKFRRYADEPLSQGGIFSPETRKNVIAAINRISSEDGKKIAIVEGKLQFAPTEYFGKDVVIQEQRDAFALALEVSNLDSFEMLGDLNDVTQQDKPFIGVLSNNSYRTVSEASIIRHDAERFADWQRESTDEWDSYVFIDPKKPNHVLTVWYADREELEHLTGTDLIYYRKHQPGYVMVQYKRMNKDGYRPDAQLEKEIQRMHRLISDAKSNGTKQNIHEPDNYRLNESPFFIKLVYPTMKRPYGNRLAQGAYLPLEYFECLLSNPQIKGERGGKLITRDNIGRYLTNTDFIALLKDGWIGSNKDMTERITENIEASLSADRGIIVACDESSNV
jgi:hypothetical protein